MKQNTESLLRMEVKGLAYAYDRKKGETVKDVSLWVGQGEFVGVIGPNGSGKSTLLKNLYRVLTPDRGSAVLDQEDLYTMSSRRAAQKMGVVGQENQVPFDFTVEEIVAMGRSPHQKFFSGDSQQDRYMIHHALEHLGMEDMAKRSFLSLSGGEKQRVLIARVIAQESDFLILDEPTNHLDIRYQMEIFDFVKRLQVTVLSAIHDLNMAALYCDRLYAMKEGRIYMEGRPEEVLTAENIEKIFGVTAHVEQSPVTGKPNIVFLPRYGGEERK